MPFEGGKVTEQWIGSWLEKKLKSGALEREKWPGSQVVGKAPPRFYIASKAWLDGAIRGLDIVFWRLEASILLSLEPRNPSQQRCARLAGPQEAVWLR